MLILSRKSNEQIVIGQNIVVTVVSISGGHVRLGIAAPREISVHREEIYRALLEGKGRAGKPNPAPAGPGLLSQPVSPAEPAAREHV